MLPQSTFLLSEGESLKIGTHDMTHEELVAILFTLQCPSLGRGATFHLQVDVINNNIVEEEVSGQGNCSGAVEQVKLKLPRSVDTDSIDFKVVAAPSALTLGGIRMMNDYTRS